MNKNTAAALTVVSDERDPMDFDIDTDLSMLGAEAVTVDEDDYDEMRLTKMGWCPSCEAFTRPNTPLTVSGWMCPDCLDMRTCGAAHALRYGFVKVDRAVI